MTWLPSHAVRRLRESSERPDLPERFRLLEPLGRGGMGSVWLARDEQLEREVAIKVLAQPLADGEAQERLLHEARILASLEHPGIVPVHDAGLLPDGRAWYAMKRVRGLRLDEHVDEATPLAERLRIFERLCETVAFAHARGVVHRDLKPGNVMVGEFGEVLVLDWGVAKLLGSREPDGVVVGTPGYMPPEQAGGRSAQSDRRSDVWGLGALLHALLLRSPPPQELPRRLSRTLPAALDAICRKALAADPAERYPDVQALRQDVARFRDGRAVSALREGPARAILRVLVRERVAVGLILAYLLMRLAVALAWGR